MLLGARLLREGVLQQSALSEHDGFCGPDKQAALLEMVLAVYDCFRELLERGVSAATIEEQDLGDVIRARDTVGSNDADGVRAIGAAVLRATGGPAVRDAPIEYTDIGAVKGPLVIVRGTRDVGWDEAARRSARHRARNVTASCSTSTTTSPSCRSTKEPSGISPSDTTRRVHRQPARASR